VDDGHGRQSNEEVELQQAEDDLVRVSLGIPSILIVHS